MTKIYKNTINIIPALFLEEFSNEKNVDNFFELSKSLINFDECYIFLINPDCMHLKLSFNPQKHLNKNITIYNSSSILKKLLEKSYFTMDEAYDENTDLIKLLKLKHIKSFLVSKLSIKESIFGFMLICKNSEKFTPDEIEIMNTIATITSYKIKDLELSEVFKIQLKALKTAIQETNAAYKTIQEQNKKIIAADKIKNEFLANVSHELRTPLNAIIGFSEILMTKTYGNLNQEQETYINDIQVSGIHLLGMINEILDISKIEANAIKMVKRYFEISLVIKEVCNILQPLSKKKNIKIEYNIANDIDIYADYQKIQQILYNLLSNAIKFTPENGSIVINVSNTRKKIKITVKDSGIGIDKKYHKKIFTKFTQLEDAYTKKESSTGLGLTITKELVEMHGGKIKVESTLKNGASFIITLPIISDFQE